jgi:hypothetical protein
MVSLGEEGIADRQFRMNLNFASDRSNPTIESFCARGAEMGNWGIHFLCVHFNIHLDHH